MRKSLIIITFVLLISATWLALTVGSTIGPPAHPQSVVGNILYAHVPGSIVALLCFVLLLIASIAYLSTEKYAWDYLAQASAETGLIYATILNVTGMLFSKAMWGIWWSPSPRLITSAVLWFLYVVYLILRTNLPGSRNRRARICAVFGIIAFLDVPMVLISARFIPDIHRASVGFTSVWQKTALLLVIVSMSMLAALLIWIRTDILKSEQKCSEI